MIEECIKLVVTEYELYWLIISCRMLNISSLALTPSTQTADDVNVVPISFADDVNCHVCWRIGFKITL